MFTYPRIDMGAFRGCEPERIEDASNPHQVRVSVDLARHQSKIPLPCFQAWFDVGQPPESFDIAYPIMRPRLRTFGREPCVWLSTSKKDLSAS